jgi:membrane fusion protein, multidrug efflux system
MQTQTMTPATNGKRRPVLIALAALFLLAAAGFALFYVLVLAEREVTDDAYVGGNQVPLMPQVAGTVVEILADETQLVAAGQPVIRLDAADADIALEQAQAALAEAVRQIRSQFATAEQLAAVVAQRKLELARAEDDLVRRKAAIAEHAVSQEELDHASSAVAVAEAALKTAERQHTAARASVAGTTVESHPSVKRAEAALRQAWLNARRNVLVAPVTGYIARRSVQLGQRIGAGAALLAIVPLDQLWVDANFKEAQLRNLRIGQSVKLEADVYGAQVEYRGKIIGLGAGTGGAFSLLPPQNASGNWIKVVQRVPVRIALEREQLREHPLRIGLSMTANVDTRERGGPVLAPAPAASPAYSTSAFGSQPAEVDRLIRRIIGENLDAKR